jgi:hypothetical protein
VPELDPHLGKATCGGVGELLAWFPLRSADLERAVSPGAVEFRHGRGVLGVCSGVRGLLVLLSFPRPAVVAREWKRMAPLSSSIGFIMVFFEMRLSRREASSGRPWWRGEDVARRDVGGWDLLLRDLGLEELHRLPHLLPV